MRRLALLVAGALAGCHGGGDDPPAPPPCIRTTAGAPWLAFSSARAGTFDIWVARADGSCLAAVTSGPGDDLFPSYGPGGRIAYGRDGKLRLHDLDSGDDWPLAVGTAAAGLYATAPSFSPDGTRVAFEGRPAGATFAQVFVAPAVGGDPVALTTVAAVNAVPAWSPDGAKVFFVSTRDGAYDVYTAPAAGGAATRVTTRSRIVGRPAPAPDGAALYYARTVPNTDATEIVRFALADGAITVVTSTATSDLEPAVSPAGDLLAVSSSRSGRPDVWLEPLQAGGRPGQVTRDGVPAGLPSFAPAR